ncbi:MAG: ribonuclease P protein component [Sulfuriferula sp.]
MTIRYTFPRSCRLLKTDEFSSVFNFCRRKSGRYLSVYVKPNFSALARLGIVVGKKQLRTAVARNFAKRIIREEFRLQRVNLPAADYVVRVTKPINKSEAPLVRKELTFLFQKTSLCLDS